MKTYLYFIFILIVLISCYHLPFKNRSEVNDEVKDAQQLITKVLEWSESNESIDLLPVISDSLTMKYIGFDMVKLKENLKKLKETNLFSSSFLENYHQIILTIDKKIRNKQYNEWLVGELPPFKFANGYDPWWNGQEYFSLNLVTVENKSIKNKEYYFKCKSIDPGCSGLENFKSIFRIEKEDGLWKVSYMQGFDFKESIKSNGEI